MKLKLWTATSTSRARASSDRERPSWRAQQAIESHARDVDDLSERRVDLLLAGVTEARLEGGEDRGLVVPAHRDDERKAEALAVGGIEPLEALVLGVGEAVETGGGLLGAGRRRQRAGARGLAGEVRMRAQQRAERSRRRAADGV